ncbi:unextended protein-like [Paramacrobiotus metropolitanus]|uniref:unextended protein-like n=1 Tax=Paramacrobiotus metropolitanus TaxID=2943436 RepID=UPI0024461B83|nr:unextended protein-like [Paramacrobiotus metropolitanus]
MIPFIIRSQCLIIAVIILPLTISPAIPDIPAPLPKSRQLRDAPTTPSSSTAPPPPVVEINGTVHVSGIRVESDNAKGFEHGVVKVVADEETAIRLFGSGFINSTSVKFTSHRGLRGEDCVRYPTGDVFELRRDAPDAETDDVASATVVLNEGHEKPWIYYMCVKHPTENRWLHQGAGSAVQLQAIPKYWIPLWIQILIIIVLQCLSGLFSGLNLGLLSLDPTELQIVASVGAPQEKKYAKNIIPLRNKGNFLLCSLVIGNVLVNSTLTIFLDDLTSGLYAVIFSTVGIVLFGEIVPQALCNRFGLAIGSATRWITWVVMGITGVISWPLSKLLDVLLGREIGTVYDRERLVELINVTKEHNLLENDEVNIISGTLALKRKTVAEIMTAIDEVYMLPYDAVLDFDTLAEITREGYTRIPIYETKRDNIVGLLNIKDMALLDPDDCTSVKTLCKYYGYELRFVFEDTTLDVMLQDFKQGHSHMAFVQKISNPEGGDPVYETLGVVTLEDIIEEMIQSEILDESDRDARGKKNLKKDFTVFQARPMYTSLITPQLQHASFQFLSTSVDRFSETLISEHILRRLIRHPEVARMIKKKPNEVTPTFVYKKGRPADFFVLVLEGRVEVQIGNEDLVFESGPFTYFGKTALGGELGLKPEEIAQLVKAPFPALATGKASLPGARISLDKSKMTGTFTPDFTVYATSDVLFLRIKLAHYIAALRATALERQHRPSGLIPSSPSAQNMPTEIDTFGQEMERVRTDDLNTTEFLPAVTATTPTGVAADPNGSAVFIKMSAPPSADNLLRTPKGERAHRSRSRSSSPSRRDDERDQLLPPAGAPKEERQRSPRKSPERK